MEQYISPRTGKPIPGVTLESHAEQQQYHYAALKDPAYRQELWQMWHEVDHEPSNAEIYGGTPKRVEQVSTPARGLKPINTTPLIMGLMNRLNRHIDASKKKPEEYTISGDET